MLTFDCLFLLEVLLLYLFFFLHDVKNSSFYIFVFSKSFLQIIMVFYLLLISLVNKMQNNFYWKDLNIRNYLLHHRPIISSSLFLLLASWANKLSDLFVRNIKQLSFNFDEVKSSDIQLRYIIYVILWLQPKSYRTKCKY